MARDPDVHILMGEAALSRGGVIRTGSVGSCVVVAVHDRRLGIGAMAHVVLPYAHEEHDSASDELPGRHAPDAVAWLLGALTASGSKVADLRSMLAGGANMFPAIIDVSAIGPRNVAAARAALAAAGVPVVDEETGGSVGRLVDFDTADGSFRVHGKK